MILILTHAHEYFFGQHKVQFIEFETIFFISDDDIN